MASKRNPASGRRRFLAKATRDVVDERVRQMEKLQWSPAHDDEHTDESLALVAAMYALPSSARVMEKRAFDRDVGRSAGEVVLVKDWVEVPTLWPQSWHGSAWKPKERRRDLVRAAALLIAEIQRLDRVEAAAHIRRHSWDPQQ